MTGHDYIAMVRLSDRGNVTLAEIGETCERVPAASLPWLITDGLIVRGQATPLAPECAEESDHGET